MPNVEIGTFGMAQDWMSARSVVLSVVEVWAGK